MQFSLILILTIPGLKSNDAIYTIPVSGTPPVSSPIVAPAMSQANTATAIPGLISTDADGTIAGYSIENLPPASQGVLSIPCPVTLTGATCTGGFQNLTAAVLANYPRTGIPLTATQMAGLRFDPASGYSGSVIFNYHATDNSGLISNSTSYTIPVTDLPPVSNNILAPKMLNTNAATAIPGLSSTDADGSISSYVINSIPPVSQGVLYYNNGASVVPVTAGLVLTPAQINTLQFDPAAGYTGNVVFNYIAYDNNNNISNVATYTIPTGPISILPLSMLHLTGERSGNNINLKWVSENEILLDKYEIEYSTTQSDFKNAGFKNALNGQINNYDYTLDNFSLPGYYIRLKAINADGKFSYSNIIYIKNSLKIDIRIYPTIADNYVNINFGSNATGNYNIQLIDITGRVFKKRNGKNCK